MLNRPAAACERLRPEQHGPLELDVRFPPAAPGQVEPLVASGGIGGNGDIVTVTYLEGSLLTLRYFHRGIGGPSTNPIPYSPGQTYKIGLTFGGLFPPVEHPVYAGWTPGQINRLRRQLQFTWNGEVVLEGAADSYPSSPGLIYLGQNPIAEDVTEPRFTGEILSRHSLGITRPTAPTSAKGTGPVRLSFVLPDLTNGPGLPLVSTGTRGAGDLVYIRITSPGRAVLGHDNWGSPAAITKEVPFTPGEPQTVTVEMGSLYPPDADVTPELRQRLRLSFNGETLFDFSRPFYPSTVEQVEFGYNTIQADAATTGFPGRLMAVERVAAAADEADAQEWGPLLLTLDFPRVLPAAVEPLVITGKAGKADIVYVSYGPDQTIRFGFDHWGIGGELSEPIKIDTAATHKLEVRMASLYPPTADNASRAKTEVWLDGKMVFAPDLVAYPPDPAARAVIGENNIGASTCGAAFTGQIILVQRLPD